MPAPLRPQLDRVRVVIADDDPAFAELLRSTLTARDDVEVVGVGNDGVEAIDLVNALKPDLVLMDVAMPRLDGIEAARRLALLPNRPRVVLITGGESPTADRRAYAAGASAYLRKGPDIAATVAMAVGMSAVTAPV